MDDLLKNALEGMDAGAAPSTKRAGNGGDKKITKKIKKEVKEEEDDGDDKNDKKDEDVKEEPEPNNKKGSQ